ncbi:hypothetical protein P3S67_014901 [Capsicum chacoense]
MILKILLHSSFLVVLLSLLFGSQLQFLEPSILYLCFLNYWKWWVLAILSDSVPIIYYSRYGSILRSWMQRY